MTTHDHSRTKVDFKRSLDSYRATHGRFRIVDLPIRHYLMIDGCGDPNLGVAFERAVEALYPVAYTLKFAGKQELGLDHVVMPLEGLWWSENAEVFTTARDKTRWNWTLMIMVPDWTTENMFRAAVARTSTRTAASRASEVRLEALTEGRCVQTLHVGPFDDEGPLLQRMHEEFIPGQGFTMTGKHHEIYLSDLRRADPAKLRTILRQPVV